MTSKNEHTGDKIKTKVPNDAYRENYDKIFKKDEPKEKKSKRCPPETLCRCDHCE